MIWIKLPDKPLDFIKKEMLSSGRSISDRILKSNKLTNVEEVFCLIRENLTFAEVYDFEAPKSFGKIDDEELIFYLESSYYDYTLIIENWMESKDDYPMGIPALFNNDEVYYYYSQKWNDLNVLRDILHWGDCYPFIAFILNIEEIKETKLDEISLDNLIPHIKEIVLRIYDLDSFMRVVIK